jgi:glycosyltransferase involved in cell wall biosynthesis
LSEDARVTRKDAPRLGFISHSPWIAGAERALVNLLRHLPAGKAHCVVVFPQTNGPLKLTVKNDIGMPVFELPYAPSIPCLGYPLLSESKMAEATAFANLYRELELDAVIVNTTVLYPASVAAALADLPLVLHSHGVVNEVLFPGLDPVQWSRIEAVQAQLADKMIVPSAWVASHYSTFFHLPDRPVVVLPNGTPIPPLEQTGTPVAPAASPQFSMLCTLEPNKGVETVIEAASIVFSKRPKGATFVVYGDGSPAYQGRLRSLIQSKGMDGRFLLRPKQMDVSSIYRNSHAVIVASHIESFSFVAIEAMSHSRAVIATRCGGPDEIVEEGKTGFLIEPGDSQALAHRILHLIDDRALCQTMGRNARAAAEARFDIQTIAEEYLSAILGTIREPRTSQWASRRRLLASLLLDCIGSGHVGDSGAPVGPDAGERLVSPPTGQGDLTATQEADVPLSTADLCSSLELLRWRLHDINADLGKA